MPPSQRMFTDDVTLLTPGTTTTRVGDSIPDWDTATTMAARGRLAQRSGSEDHGPGRAAEISEWRLYLPVDVVISAACRVVHDGRTFEVIGPPYLPTVARGVGHQELTLRLVEG